MVSDQTVLSAGFMSPCMFGEFHLLKNTNVDPLELSELNYGCFLFALLRNFKSYIYDTTNHEADLLRIIYLCG